MGSVVGMGRGIIVRIRREIRRVGMRSREGKGKEVVWMEGEREG